MELIKLLLSAPSEANNSNEVAWVDKVNKEYRMKDIADSHLMNILRFMCRGKGHLWFLTNTKVESLFDEADRRGLRHRFSVSVALDALRDRRY